jgi:2-polyprenyl-6-hydroxyphenyl methylase/3-demethylubiquinone-9 3-methyltransferase
LVPFDVVYSWGVLHHTGDMWRALGNMPPLVNPGGDLVLSIYNDQGMTSRLWKVIKQGYNRLPEALRAPYALAAVAPNEVRGILASIAKGRFSHIWKSWTEYGAGDGRGMDKWHDIVDWVGGYPFEVASPEAIFDFFHRQGFDLEQLRTCRGELSCNEFRFRKRRIFSS